jgi:hypothetical protein
MILEDKFHYVHISSWNSNVSLPIIEEYEAERLIVFKVIRFVARFMKIDHEVEQ